MGYQPIKEVKDSVGDVENPIGQESQTCRRNVVPSDREGHPSRNRRVVKANAMLCDAMRALRGSVPAKVLLSAGNTT